MKITLETEKLEDLNINKLLVCEIINYYGIKDYEIISSIIKKKKDTVYRYVKELEDEGYIKADTINYTDCDRYVYLAEDLNTGHLKIGVSINPEDRCRMLSYKKKTSIALLTFIEGGYRKEKELHSKYKHLNIVDEWFIYDENIINEFKSK